MYEVMNILKKFLGEDDVDELENEEMEDNDTKFDPVPAVQNARTEKPKPEFVLVKPDKRDDLLSIADHLMKRKTVILNLEMVSKDTRRFVDFLSGVAYALNGQVKKVASNTFLVIPGGVEITGDIFDDIESEISY